MDVIIALITGVVIANLAVRLIPLIKLPQKAEKAKTEETPKERIGLGIGWEKEGCPPHAWANKTDDKDRYMGLFCGKCKATFP